MINFLEKFSSKTFKNFLVDFLPKDTNFEDKVLDVSGGFTDFKSAKIIASSDKLNNLKVLEINLENSKDKRISNTRDIFRLLSKFSIDNALVITSFKTGEYRFSFIKISYSWKTDTTVKKNYTNPRRLSFLLGPDTKSYTPTIQLLNKGRIKDYNDLLERFDIEVVSEEFYDKYKFLFDQLKKYFIQDNNFSKFAKKNKIEINEICKKTLGQITFCYFLQKKGWLGAKKNEEFYWRLFLKK